MHDGINKDDACSIEKELIKKYGRICDKSGILTNISIGGDIASLGVIFSEEHRNKISESNKGRKISEETRLKMKLAKSGKKLTEEHKLKLSKVRIGLKLSDDSKKKISIGNFGNKKCLGRKMTEDNKIKLSKANRIKVMCLNNGIVYNSALLAAKDLGISDKHIGSVCRGNRPHTCNYKFKHILE